MANCEPAAGGIATISNFSCLFSNVVKVALGFAGIVLFILLIVGGFKYITSGGDPKAIEGAKKTLTSAILGLVLILVSYLILVLISAITGVDVTLFKITI
jgi:Type IV secretion system pilin